MLESTPNVTNPVVPETPVTNRYQTLAEFLSVTEVALTNALGTDILPLLTTRGYTDTIINGKLSDLSALRLLEENQEKEFGEKLDATAIYRNKRIALSGDYTDHLSLARIAFKGNLAAQTALGLKGKRKLSNSGFSNQGLLFYDGIIRNASYKAAIALKGVSETELSTMQVSFLSFGTLESNQQKESGESQEATTKRDAAFDILHDWMIDFKEVAIVALRKTPQLREKLGYKE